MRKVKSIRSLWSHILSPAWKICWVLGQVLAVGRCPAARQQQQGRWLWWQWLLFCQLHIFFRSLISKPPSVPLDLPMHCSRQWLQGAEVSRAVARRDSSHRVQALTSPSVPAACRAWHGSQNHPGDVFGPALSPTSTGIPSETLLPSPSLSPAESNQGEIQRCWVQAGADPPSLFTVSCAVGSSSPTEINGIMNTN